MNVIIIDSSHDKIRDFSCFRKYNSFIPGIHPVNPVTDLEHIIPGNTILEQPFFLYPGKDEVVFPYPGSQDNKNKLRWDIERHPN